MANGVNAASRVFAMQRVHSQQHTLARTHHAQSMLMFMIMIMVMRATSKCNATIKMNDMTRARHGMASHGTMIHWL